MANVLGMAFIPYYNHLIEILDTNKELRKSAEGIFKQVAWGAGGTIIGGACGGPPGALVGGIIGSMYGYFKSDDYQAMITVIKNMSDRDKEELVKKVQELVGSSSIEALTRFIGNQVQRDLLLRVIRDTVLNTKGG